ncbi:hypothetical protein GRAN_2504 [Granulicella sibirica]|uniref:Uncharacterized protein n=1 Tax=Granulicella sibirica TaxID=2479048 RepID=A0A4Q0SXQ4_9BACT|nr:hypothetical protein GRAN_2504 [Granulicella sibirica]
MGNGVGFRHGVGQVRWDRLLRVHARSCTAACACLLWRPDGDPRTTGRGRSLDCGSIGCFGAARP